MDDLSNARDIEATESYLRNLLAQHDVEMQDVLPRGDHVERRFLLSRPARLYVRDLVQFRHRIRVSNPEMARALNRGTAYATMFEVEEIEITDLPLREPRASEIAPTNSTDGSHPFRDAYDTPDGEEDLNEQSLTMGHRGPPTLASFVAADANGHRTRGFWFAEFTLMVNLIDHAPAEIKRAEVTSIAYAGTEIHVFTAHERYCFACSNMGEAWSAFAKWIPTKATRAYAQPIRTPGRRLTYLDRFRFAAQRNLLAMVVLFLFISGTLGLALRAGGYLGVVLLVIAAGAAFLFGRDVHASPGP